jgi:hypothetical protein
MFHPLSASHSVTDLRVRSLDVGAHTHLGSIGGTLRHLQSLNAKERVYKDIGAGTFHDQSVLLAPVY